MRGWTGRIIAGIVGTLWAGHMGLMPVPADAAVRAHQAARSLEPGQAERLRRIMLPLLRVMDHPLPADKVQVSVMDDAAINAGSAGSGHFVVTTGLLEQASDEHLMGVLAHEVAHDDLGHVARQQMLGTGMSIASVLIGSVLPGVGQFAPLAGSLVTRAYGRREEYQADQHGAELLRRLGYSPQVMVGTLDWLLKRAGPSGGGFFATHPATGDRIARLRQSIG
jgi:Zn-dependent protease with chaperone function